MGKPTRYAVWYSIMFAKESCQPVYITNEYTKAHREGAKLQDPQTLFHVQVPLNYQFDKGEVVHILYREEKGKVNDVAISNEGIPEKYEVLIEMTQTTLIYEGENI